MTNKRGSGHGLSMYTIILIAASLFSAPGLAGLEISAAAGSLWSSAWGPAIETKAAVSDEFFGRVFSARYAGEGSAAWYSADAIPGTATSASNGFYGDALASAEFSTMTGPLSSLFRFYGKAESPYPSSTVPLYSAGVGLAFVFNSFDFSVSLEPRLSWQSGATGWKEMGVDLGASFLAGEFLVKPGADLAWIQWEDGSDSLSLRPGLGFSWYPGFPFSVSADSGFTRTWLPGGAFADEIPFRASFYAAFGASILATAAMGISIAVPDAKTASAMGSTEVSLNLGRFGGASGESPFSGELRLPCRYSWDLKDGWSAGVGLKFTFD
jgi:hypothetical protein